MTNTLKRLLIFATWGTCGLLPMQTSAQEIPSAMTTDAQYEDSAANLSDFSITTETNMDRQPTSVGFRIPARLIERPMTRPLVAFFPPFRHIPFKHVYFLWEAHGHEPPGIYDLPHFDIHFYLLSNRERKAITCMGADAAVCIKQPAAGALPSNYVPTPAGVPGMGWHWADALSPEFHGSPLTATMIYGYYNGRLAFYEPMVTQAFFLTKPSFSAPIRQPQVFPKPGYYPTSYSISYVSVIDSYDIKLNGLVYRQ